MKHICSALKRNGEKGFTLVELIVVIAILAILAAVAYPVYTGYITKANEAADLALLGQVNESFASALYDVGYYDGLPPKATFELGTTTVNIGENGAIRLDAKKLPATGLTDNPSLNAAFDQYYEGNEGSTFKVFETLIYDGTTGGFAGQYGDMMVLANGNKMEIKDNEDGSHTYTVTGKDGKKYEYTLRDDDLKMFTNSTFGQNMEMSSLMGEMDNVVKALTGVIKSDETLLEKLKSKIGGDDYLKTLGVTKENYPNDDDYLAALSNAVVMSVADASAGLTADDITAQEGRGSQKWQDLMKNNQFAMLAALYGSMTGYANSDIGRTSISNVTTSNGETMTAKEYYDKQSKALRELTDPDDAQDIILSMVQTFSESSGMQQYKDSGAYANDLNAYFSAMNALAENKDTLVSQGTMSSGFADKDLGAILDAVFGGGNG